MAITATPSLKNGVLIGVHFLGLTEEDWLAMEKSPETAKPVVAEIKRIDRKQKIPIRFLIGICFIKLAPQHGFEPRTHWLTANCSAN